MLSANWDFHVCRSRLFSFDRHLRGGGRNLTIMHMRNVSAVRLKMTHLLLKTRSKRCSRYLQFILLTSEMIHQPIYINNKTVGEQGRH